MSKHRIIRFIAPAVLLAGIVAWRPGTLERARADDPADDLAAQVRKLAQRIAALEKTVARNPYHPQDTVLARLDTLEEQIKTMQQEQRRAGDSGDLARELKNLKSDLDRQNRTLDDLKTRVTKLEAKR